MSMCSTTMKEGQETYFSVYVTETVMIYFFTTAVATAIVSTVLLLVNWDLLYLSGVVLFIPLAKPLVKKCVPKKRVSPAGKAVLITGCDTGFGHMLAQRLDDLGFQVFAGCLFPGSNGAEELRKSGSSRLHVVGLDVTSDSSVQEAATYVQENLQDNLLWAVVNNAGIAHAGDLSWADLEKIIRVLEVNTIGVIRLSKKFLATLMKTKGRVVTNCSILGQVTLPGAVPYSMSKAAAIRFSEGLRLEMRKWGVKSISIIPFLYRTPLFSAESVNNQIGEAWEKTPKDIKDIYGSDYIGCDTGFGHMLAQRLDDLGFQVFAGCLFPNGDGAVDLRKSGSSRLHVVGIDVTSDSSVQEAAAYVKENLKNNVLWAVVNNAGIGCFGDISWTSMEKVLEVFDVNAIGVVRVTNEFLPTLMKTKGRVITVASIGGWLISPGFVPYSMTKSAVISFSEGLRLEMRKWGVRSISILPYLYRTPICSEEATTALVKKEWHRAPKVIKAIYGPDYISKYLEQIVSQINTLGRRSASEVVSVMEESIVTLFPESSYSVGGTAYISLFRIGKYLLPEAVIDLVLCKFVSKREV